MTDTCSWLGNGEQCSHTVVLGRSYCQHHIWQVYQEGSAVRRKKDTRRAAAVWDIQSAFNEAVEELEDEGYDFSLDRWEPEVEED